MRKMRVQATGGDSESRLFLDSIIENIPDMIFVKDAKNLRFVRFNRAGEKLLGYPRRKMLGKNDYDFFPKKEADFFTSKDRAVLRSRRLVDIPEEEIQTRSGHRYLHTKKIPILDKSGKPLYLLGISEDITRLKRAEMELKRRERQRFESQKLESIGRLAGGVAHEFNNILTGILGLAKFISDDSGNAKSDAEEIIAQCRRAGALVAQLLAFSRRPLVTKARVDLTSLLKAMRKVLQAALGEVQLTLDLDSGLSTIEADGPSIERVVLNLCLNARDAVANRRGAVRIVTREVVVKKRVSGSRIDIPPGRYVRMSIVDNGAGISEKDMPRLFEPFFTTKRFGRGNGLGLSVVYGIVRQSAAHIDVSSVVGRGTTMSVYWPAARGHADEVARSQKRKFSRGGDEAILLAEDDHTTRGVLGRYLKQLGYRVFAAADGKEAIRLLRARASRIDFALLDVRMPYYGGLEVYERAMRMNPAMRAVLMSGYADRPKEAEILKAGLSLLRKPFSPDVAAQRIRKFLDR